MIDLEYICTTMGNLAGIPIRIFREGELALFHSLISFPQDPMKAHWQEVLAVDAAVGYYITQEFCYYGVINCLGIKIVLGPTSQAPLGNRELNAIAFQAGVNREDREAFRSAMKAVIHMPLESVMQMLCVLNYCLTGEKYQLGNPDYSAPGYPAPELPSLPHEAPLVYTHNTLSVEKKVMDLVERGDLDGLRQWMKTAPAVRAGLLSSHQLRQHKNIFIVTVTLTARAAIRGGVDPEEALSLSDSYIQQCELLLDPAQILRLQISMVLDYARRSQEVHNFTGKSHLAVQVFHYVRHHLSSPVSTKDVAQALYMSRPYLSSKFKAETGLSLSTFILKIKIEEAKRLLCQTDQTATSIGAYLCFSSQSHFTRAFEKIVGCTPRAYRQKNKEKAHKNTDVIA